MFKFELTFANSFFTVMCNTWEEVDREVKCFGVDNLLCIRENHNE